MEGEGRKIEWGWGYWPAKLKTEHGALSIGLVLTPLTGGIVDMYSVM
jgi:hypothetical protein